MSSPFDDLIRAAARSTRYGSLILRYTNADNTPGGQGLLELPAEPARAVVKMPPEPSAIMELGAPEGPPARAALNTKG